METGIIIKIIIEILLMGLALFVLSVNLKIYKDNKNPMDLAVFFILLFITLKETVYGINHILGKEDNYYDFIFDGRLPLPHFFDMILAMIGLWFIFYLYEKEAFYTVPIVVGYFAIAYAYELKSTAFTTNIIIVFVLLTNIAHFLNVIKNKNGMSFAIGIVGVLGIVNYFIGFFEIGYVFRFMYIILLFLGLTGWLDENVFYDREKRRKIENSWIVTYVS